jgi:hypothetical protein
MAHLPTTSIGAAKWIRTTTALGFNQALYRLELSLHNLIIWWSTEGIEPHARRTWVTTRLWTIHTYWHAPDCFCGLLRPVSPHRHPNPVFQPSNRLNLPLHTQAELNGVTTGLGYNLVLPHHLVNPKTVLSRLKKLVPKVGLAPTTVCLQGSCSAKLSYSGTGCPGRT